MNKDGAGPSSLKRLKRLNRRHLDEQRDRNLHLCQLGLKRLNRRHLDELAKKESSGEILS